MFTRLSTWRHGRGFGVHSPLAYRLIADILRDRPAYYADSRIDAMSANKRARRIARIVVRLAAYFRPASFGGSDADMDIVRLADSRITRAPGVETADFVIERTDSMTHITVGRRGSGTGPLTLTNLRDLTVTIHRAGLSQTTVNTTL